MTRQIDVETLREWLDEQRPVTVLDIRMDEDRGQWFIPGSVHLNVYEAIKTGGCHLNRVRSASSSRIRAYASSS